MLSLGFCGGLNLVHEDAHEVSRAFTHDGAAVLVEDGEVVAAIEEERLNRIKHSNKFPVEAMRFCLERRGIGIADVDRIAFYATEEYCNALLGRLTLGRPEIARLGDARRLIANLIERQFGAGFDPRRLTFTPHHLAHAASAYAMSGFDESLVLTIDGYGDFRSGVLGVAKEGHFTELEIYPQNRSLGLMYLEVIQFMGYGSFDEYKVMGLAPYGRADRYLPLLRECYALLPKGRYELRLDKIAPTLMGRVPPREKGQPFTQEHKDLAQALQVALEEIVLHLLSHRRAGANQSKLCLAGGVAHNCTMNGKIMKSGLFDQIFIQPAAHDAGCALGAALLANGQAERRSTTQLPHVFWGTDLGDHEHLQGELERWADFVAFERVAEVERAAGALLAEGKVIGWAQGRSEFGPRALGNRSILADPRPAENKRRINEMVKKREGYRPFAPSVLVEEAREYFEFAPGIPDLAFMTVVVDVREKYRQLLGAITHIDGTARIQTVSRSANPRYWGLIRAFQDLTGVPLVLNTSFNNNAEPIVDSAGDAIVTFLTTGLDRLVVGDFIATKREVSEANQLKLSLELPTYVRVERVRGAFDGRRTATKSHIRTSYDPKVRAPISNELGELLMGIEGRVSLSSLLDAVGNESRSKLLEEIRSLWASRLVRLTPSASPAGASRAQGASAAKVSR
jgi:carbamoyltransferase